MTSQSEAHRAKHPIRVVALRTGLSVAAIRAWENRYQVVEPARTPGGQRLYRDADIERLTLLRRATLAGRSISRAAHSTDDELRALLADDEAAVARQGPPPRPDGEMEEGVADAILETAMVAVENRDGARLERVLQRAVLQLRVADFAEQVAAPLLRRIGESWHAGTLTISHEHIASAAVRRALEWMSQTVNGGRRALSILVGTPAGERHELGAILAVVAASTEGWSVTYAGADMPAADLAQAADAIGADVVALSVVYAGGDDGWRGEVRELRRLLPNTVTLVVGGAASRGLAVAPHGGTLVQVDDLSSFRMVLQRHSAGIDAVRP